MADKKKTVPDQEEMPKEDQDVCENADQADDASQEAETAGQTKQKSSANSEEGDTDKQEEAATAETAEDADHPEEEQPEEEEQEEETQDDESAEETKEQGRSKKSRLSRKKGKDKTEQKLEEVTDRLQRTMAEFDNFRKRTDKEKASMYIIGAKEIIEKILPIVDNFERGLENATEGDAFSEGMEKTYKLLMTTLDDLGVKPIEAVGKPFDPNLHNAVMHVEDEEAGENMVIEEFQKGYTYKDFVVRHSMVKVAN